MVLYPCPERGGRRIHADGLDDPLSSDLGPAWTTMSLNLNPVPQ